MKVELISVTQRNPALTAQVAAGYSDLSALFQGRGDFAENLIEYAGRVCYRSTHRMGTAPGFIVDRVREGHEDIIEHMVIVLRFVGTDQPRWFRTYNRHVEVSNLGRRGWLVSANARVWLDLLAGGAIYEAAPILYTLAPSVFGVYASYGKADVSGVTGIPHSLHTLTTIPALLPYENGPMRVSLLGYTQPAMIEPSIGRTHSAATFFFEGISRACTHQLVRHRLASYCLAGDTLIPSFRGKHMGGNTWTMRQLWEWQNDAKRKGRLRLIRLRGVNERNELVPVRIGKVINSGYQQLYRVTTESGRVIRSTLNHRFLTPAGWKRLGELSAGDNVLSNGIPAYQNREYLQRRYLVENMGRAALAESIGVSDACLGVWIRKFGLQKPKTQYPNRRPGHGVPGMVTPEQKKAISARFSGSRNHSWRGEDVGAGGSRRRARLMFVGATCSGCGAEDGLERHHIDRNPFNNAPSNIVVLCSACHHAHHHTMTMTVFSDAIKAIELDKVEETFDLEIVDDCHNFVANGIVVHNSQESQRYVDMSKGEWKAIIPPAIKANPQALAEMQDFWALAEEKYQALRAMGIRKEDARFLLPNATETRIVVTMNFDSWSHFFWLRAVDKAAQWEIREMAQAALRMLYTIAPEVFFEHWKAYQEIEGLNHD